jgi:site-specific recombinase XerD
VSALCFLFEAFLGRPRLALAIPRPKKERRLPEVLSPGEVARLLEKTRNHKHRVLLMLLYSAGLRVGELVRLRPANDAYIFQAQATSPAACAAAASPGSA